MRRLGRSAHPGLVLPAVVLQVGSWFAMLAHGTTWTGAWRNAVDIVGGTTVITGPLLAALVADAYARRARTSLPALAVTAVHPVSVWYGPLTRLGMLAAANLGVVLVEAACLVAAGGTPLLVEPLVVVPVCVLVLLAHALVGMVVGLRVGPKLAGTVAATASFGLFLLAVAHLAPEAFDLSSVTGDLVGTSYRLEVLAVLGLIAFVSSAALLTGTAWATRWASLRAGSAIIATAVAMILGAGGVVDLDSRFEPVPVSLRCRGSAPEVCIPAEAPRALSAVSRRMHQLARPLREVGAELPERWVYSWGQAPDPGAGVLVLWSGGVLEDHAPANALLHSLAMPARCATFFADVVDERSSNVQLLLETWLRVRNGLGTSRTRISTAWFFSPESERWVRTTYAQLRRCDLDALRYPPR